MNSPHTPEGIFAPLKAQLEAMDANLGDVFDLIAELTFMSQMYGSAAALHVRDILNEWDEYDEDGDVVFRPHAEIISEMYRRTFFDDKASHLYGTGDLFDRGPEALKEFADYLAGCLCMDAAQVAGGTFINGPEHHQ